MAFTSGFTAVTGAVLTAAQWNTNVRDNMTAIWVGTTAGDIDYYTSATAKARLAFVSGGVLYGGASAPAWLAKPSSSLPQFLKNTSTGTPSYSYPSLFGTRVYNSVDQSVANNAVVLFDTEFYDDEGLHSTSSNKERQTIVTVGRYNAHAHIEHNGDSASNIYNAYIVKNGLVTVGSAAANSVSSAAVYLDPIALGVTMDPGDYLTVVISNITGSTPHTVTGGAGHSTFTVERCGPY